jgi:hypothetical protein
MAFLDSIGMKIARALRLDSKFLFAETGEMSITRKAFAPSLVSQHPMWSRIYNLGGIGFTLACWADTMAAAAKFRSHFHACLRYEDLLVSKEKLVLALLRQCDIGTRSAALEKSALDSVFSSDAHGESATTSSKRFKKGSGRLFVKPEDEAEVVAILASLNTVTSSDFIIADTLQAN